MAISTWIDKETGNPKTTLAEFNSGVSKAGNKYQITDTKRTIVVDKTIQAGTFVSYNMTPAKATEGEATPDIKFDK